MILKQKKSNFVRAAFGVLLITMLGLVVLTRAKYTPVISEKPSAVPSLKGSVFDAPEIQELLKQAKSNPSFEPPQTWAECGFVVPFYDFLEQLINTDIASQSEEYRRAVCRIVLRYALAFNPELDTIYAAKNKNSWEIGGNITIRWSDGTSDKKEAVTRLLHIIDGEVVGFKFWAGYDTCDGFGGSCCGGTNIPNCFDKNMMSDMILINTGHCVPFGEITVTGEELMHIAEINKSHLVYKLSLDHTEAKSADETYLRELTNLVEFQYTGNDVDVSEKIVEQLKFLPNLRWISLQVPDLSQKSIDDLGQCRTVERLTLMVRHPKGIRSLQPLNHLKSLTQLGIYCNRNQLPADDFQLENATFTLSDFPNLMFIVLTQMKETNLVIDDIPKLQRLDVDVKSLQGNVFSEQSPVRLNGLGIPCDVVQREHLQCLTDCVTGKNLELYRVVPEKLEAIQPLFPEVRKLKMLTLHFLPGLYEGQTLNLTSRNIETLFIKFNNQSSLHVDLGQCENLKSVWTNYPDSIVNSNSISLFTTEF